MNGIKQISGLKFTKDINYDSWASNPYPGIWIVLSGSEGCKCFLHDLSDDSKFNFQTVVAANSFAKRKRHGRSIEEHKRAEIVQEERERNGWSVADIAKILEVSPRTIEAWSSGARAVPKIVIIALKATCNINL